MRRLAGLLCAMTLLAGGCAKDHDAVRPSAPPAMGPRVALAPMENRSNDLSASEIIRGAFAEELANRGWNVLPTAESDQALRESLGISYGGQLAATTPAEVCKALGIEGVFYGEVSEWNKTTTGFYNTISVAAFFKLYRKDGTLAWEGNDAQKRVDTPRGGGGDLGAEIVARALGNLLLNPMTPYGRSVARNIARKLPSGIPAAPPAGPPKPGAGPANTKGGDK